MIQKELEMIFEEERIVKVYRITVKKIIERLLSLQEIPCFEFESEVEEQFEGYDYKDVENVVGFAQWPDISMDGEYQLHVKIDHEEAYEFTLFVVVKDQKVSVVNVL